MLRTLRQPRYAALSALMLLVALICVAAGTWQISRFDGKVSANDKLRGNAHAASVPLGDVLPLVSAGKAPGSRQVEYRTITATGTYDDTFQTVVRQESIGADSDDGTGSQDGFFVLTPLRTSDGYLLVVRGFLASVSSGDGAPAAPPAPSGQVSITARVQPADTRSDKVGEIPRGEVDSINPTEQSARLGLPMYDGYAELFAHQPGVGNLTPIPSPDLSNPAGGAVEPQHFAYIIQWYLFALLALAAPLAMVRAERRQKPEHEDDDELPPEPAAVVATQTPEDHRAAKLADRYGRVVR